jgi:hypothetical protein
MEDIYEIYVPEFNNFINKTYNDNNICKALQILITCLPDNWISMVDISDIIKTFLTYNNNIITNKHINKVNEYINFNTRTMNTERNIHDGHIHTVYTEQDNNFKYPIIRTIFSHLLFNWASLG